MTTLGRFRFAGKHLLNIVSGLYLAASIANRIGRVAPNLRVATFIVLAVAWVLTGVAVIIRELHGDRDSLVSVGIGALPFVIIGIAVALLLSRVVSRYIGDPGVTFAVAEAGVIFFVGGYLAVMRDAYHKKKLEEDLAQRPPKSSNQAMQRTAGRSAF